MFNLRNISSPFCKVHSLRISCVFYSSSKNYTEEIINVGKYNINYLKVGNGAHHVICMPGSLGTIWSNFQPQVEGFDREKFTLIAWDLAGYGKSRPPERDFSATFFESDAQVAYDLIKALRISKISLLGYSYGGITSMILAAMYPEVVQKLVIWSTSSFLLPNEIETYKRIKDVDTWSEIMRKPYEEVHGKELFPKLWGAWVDAMVDTYNTRKGNHCEHLLKDIVCPTFILFGKKDPLIDSVHAYHLHTHIQGARMHLYPEGKHNIHVKYAEDFNKRVQEFLLED